jgi:hypothetical protein
MAQDPIFEWIKVLLPPFAAFGLGYWSVRSIERLKTKSTKPIIEIQGYVLPKEIDIKVDEVSTPFIANRIIVINKGGSGAKDCKVYIRSEVKGFDIQNEIERVGWMLPDENTALTVTLNVNTPEYVDLCAISKDGKLIALTNERGFKGKPAIVDLAPLWPGKSLDVQATLIVASSNAEPAEERFTFHIITPDENNRGIIVKFAQAPPQTTETPSLETISTKATLYNRLTDWMNKK